NCIFYISTTHEISHGQGPDQNRTAPHHRVRLLGNCGRVLLALSLSQNDPFRTSSQSCRAGRRDGPGKALKLDELISKRYFARLHTTSLLDPARRSQGGQWASPRHDDRWKTFC